MNSSSSAPLLAGRTSSSSSGTAAADDRVARLLEGLNPQQRAAVLHAGSPLLIVAGAGSGKTSVLTRRIAYLLAARDVTPGQILAITFTNKAAAEMRERVIDLVGPRAAYMWVSTFHSTCVRILRAQSGLLESMNSNFSIYDADDSKRLLGMIIRDLDLDPKKFSPRGVSVAISNFKNELISPDGAAAAVNEDDLAAATIARIFAEYQRRLRAANAFDFDDLIGETVALLQRHPQVAEYYRRRFRHVLVDEYQDTNHAQYVLIRELVGEQTTASGLEPSELCVVGDADQSIYAFRGATIRNIEEFERDFTNAETVLLEQNYRSTQTILSAANAVIARNTNRREKKLWTDSGDGELIVGYVADSDREESTFIAKEIEEITDYSIGGSSSHKYSDIAVFYRTNTGSRAIEEVFVRHGIPYKVVGGTKFYERKEVRDVVAYLRVIANPDDSVSLRRILNTPRRGIGDRAEACVAVHSENTGRSFYESLIDASEGKVALLNTRAVKQIGGFVELIEGLRADFLTHFGDSDTEDADTAFLDATEESTDIGELVDAIVERTGYRAELEASNDPQDGARLDNINELVAVAREFSADAAQIDLEADEDPSIESDREGEPEPGSLAAFLERVSLVADADQVPDEGDGVVTMMTLHTAKGLEFPVVFVTGWEDGHFPHMRALGDPAELSEERRLAYVGITRAKQRLYLTRSVTRASWGQPVSNPESRFLQEIPQHLIDWRRTEPRRSARGFGGSSGGVFGRDGSFSGSGSGGSSFGRGRSSYSSDPARGRNKQVHFDIGDRHNHPKYGMGKVVAKEGSGATERVTIDYGGSAGRVTLLTAGGIPGEKL
ncbi:UvrD-helicase domain-containing protein [Gordonia amicalis]|uniref:DNA 3'-5' helicase n=1 Tax=Gordonia amicalis TaxID=89053 RepID=A0ABU4DC40_9ACTN|nr:MULTISPECIES: UvrD-helicase domain-containing protein [Gordonia]ATD69957.1 ATP-dependent DNA helicase PcrA [Gordonia sp. 1D]MDV6306971.1 UvrD-helicase domain-containing protein [Gordonia amicalis]MDV7100145.1 UvrD-helicase domain-containing protein [Gordonia amicalis]MDV7174736.1 UvrD-helicase domain-containing protein [Gordonia amicalis]UOG21185.1 UvrD-helicase domain-containing protein [Gordonia amicalis]